jgi:hypothetical protein
MSDQLTNPFPLVSAVLREALVAIPAGDSLRVRDAIRRKLMGRQRAERLNFEAALAWAAAVFATKLPEEQRAEVFAQLDADPQELAQQLFAHYFDIGYRAGKALANGAEKASWN